MQKVRIFSVRRLALSVVLGFLLPLGYSFLLSEASDYIGKAAPEFLVMPFGWPRPLWIFLMGRQPTENDIIGGIIFLAVCNTLLYGVIVYVALLMFSVARRKRVGYESPPPPEHFHSGPE
jgi:hypothetical protein